MGTYFSSKFAFQLNLILLNLQTDIAIDVVKTCILQLRNHNRGYLHLLGRCPPQVVQEAVRRIKNELLSGSSLAHWVQNDVTISVRSSQQFFDSIIKGILYYYLNL